MAGVPIRNGRGGPGSRMAAMGASASCVPRTDRVGCGPRAEEAGCMRRRGARGIPREGSTWTARIRRQAGWYSNAPYRHFAFVDPPVQFVSGCDRFVDRLDNDDLVDLFVDVKTYPNPTRAVDNVRYTEHGANPIGAVEYLASSKAPFTLVRGEPGQGKSTLGQYLRRSIDQSSYLTSLERRSSVLL